MRRYLLPRFSQTALSGDKARVYGDLMRLGGDEIAQLTVEGVLT